MTKAFAGFRLPKAFDEVKNFYIIGQWTEIGGGLPPAIRNGRDVARMIKSRKRT
jgi:phytoene dehydrogenase-like protein